MKMRDDEELKQGKEQEGRNEVEDMDLIICHSPGRGHKSVNFEILEGQTPLENRKEQDLRNCRASRDSQITIRKL